MATNKKNKKAKGKTVSLQDFIGDSNDVQSGYAVVPKKVISSWADEMESVSANEDYTLDFGAKDRVVLPTAPRLARGPDVDMAKVPTSPPFTAFIGNLPYDIEPRDIEVFFKDIQVVNVRLPRSDGSETGRHKGFGYVEFPSREMLLQALAMTEMPIRGRTIRIDIAGNNENESERGGGMDRRGGSDRGPDKTAGDWRSGGRTFDSGRDEGSGNYSSYSDNRRDYGRNDENRGGGGGFRDRNYGGDDKYGFGPTSRERDTFGSNRDRDSGFGGNRDRDSGFGNRDRDYGNRDRDGWRNNDRSGGGGGFDGGERYSRGGGGGGRNERFGGRDRYGGGEERDRDYGGGSGGFERGGGRDRDGGGGGGRRDYGSGYRDNREPYQGRGSGNYERFNRDRDQQPSEKELEREQPDRSAGSDAPRERPKLALKPRSVPVDNVTNVPGSGASTASSIFGGAKPVDTTAREREIEERLQKQKLDDPKEKEAAKEGGDGPPSSEEGRRDNRKDDRDYDRPRRSRGESDRSAQSDEDGAYSRRGGGGGRRNSPTRTDRIPPIPPGDRRRGDTGKENQYGSSSTVPRRGRGGGGNDRDGKAWSRDGSRSRDSSGNRRADYRDDRDSRRGGGGGPGQRSPTNRDGYGRGRGSRDSSLEKRGDRPPSDRSGGSGGGSKADKRSDKPRSAPKPDEGKKPANFIANKFNLLGELDGGNSD